MENYICSRCEVRCDPGELVGKVCIWCLEKEKQEQLRQSEVTKIMNSPSYQMGLNLEGIK